MDGTLLYPNPHTKNNKKSGPLIEMVKRLKHPIPPPSSSSSSSPASKAVKRILDVAKSPPSGGATGPSSLAFYPRPLDESASAPEGVPASETKCV